MEEIGGVGVYLVFLAVGSVFVVRCNKTKREQKGRVNGKDKRKLFETEGRILVSGNSKESKSFC